VRGISHGKKLSIKNLALPMPGEENEWFWSEVNMSGITPLLTNGYENISHGFVYAMTERWHEETSSFHLPVGEMTITLDDVACLLGASHVSFGVLKRRYEELLNRCNQPIEIDTLEEQHERAQVRLACVKAFMLLLLG